MGFDPSEPRDETGKWSGSGGGGGKSSSVIAGKARQAIDWVKSGEAGKAIAGAITEDRVKAVVTFGIQSALYHVAQVDDAIIDAYVEHQVHNISNQVQVSQGMAREMMLEAVGKLIAARQAATQSGARTWASAKTLSEKVAFLKDKQSRQNNG